MATAFTKVHMGSTMDVIATARFAASFPVLVRALEIDPEHRLLREPLGQTSRLLSQLLSQLLRQLLSQLHSLWLSVVRIGHLTG